MSLSFVFPKNRFGIFLNERQASFSLLPCTNFDYDFKDNYGYGDMIKDPKHEKDNPGHATADEFALHKHEKTQSGPAVCSVCR